MEVVISPYLVDSGPRVHQVCAPIACAGDALSIYIDEKTLKGKAEKVLCQVGVTTTDAVTMLLQQIVLQKGLPFDVRVPAKRVRLNISATRSFGFGLGPHPLRESDRCEGPPRQKREKAIARGYTF